MGQEEAVPVLVPTPATATGTVLFSWGEEHEPGVKSKAAVWTPPAAAALVVEEEEEARAAGGGMPESPVKKKAPTRRLSVPPPPGRDRGRDRAASLPSTRSFSRSYRSVRPEDDPFLAAYLACTKNTGRGRSGGDGGGGKRSSAAREPKGQQKGLLAWAGLGHGLGLGLSCKRSNGVVEQSMVRVGKLPELNPAMDS